MDILIERLVVLLEAKGFKVQEVYDKVLGDYQIIWINEKSKHAGMINVKYLAKLLASKKSVDDIDFAKIINNFTNEQVA